MLSAWNRLNGCNSWPSCRYCIGGQVCVTVRSARLDDMGRITETNERRLERVEASGLRDELVGAAAVFGYAEDQVDVARINLRYTVERALEAGVSYRDLELLLDIPRASINQLVKPYKPAA
jgi:hypothetical protein